MSCGMLAFIGNCIPIKEYYAYEIDKYAVQTTQHNFPFIKQCGDVFEADFSKYKNIDYLIGGSPCTYWSIAQKNDNRETEAKGMGWELFSQYVRALNEAKPKYFLYENNKSMSKAIYKSISEAFGFEPILINSALVSAQNRNRYYWCGKRNDDGTYSKVDISQPEDKGILLKDILEGITDRDKSRTVISSIGRTTTREYFKKHQNTMTFEPVGTTKDGKSFTVTAYYSTGQNAPHTLEKHIGSMVAEPIGTTKDEKSYCLTSGYANGSGENIGNYAAHTLEKGCKSMVAEPVACRCRGRTDKNGNGYAKYECRDDCKSNTLDTNSTNGNMVAEPVRIPKYGIDNKARPLNACYQNNCGGFEHRIWNNNPNKQQVDLIAESVAPVNTTADGKAQCLRATCYNASCAENFYEFTDTKANTLTTAHKPKIIDELSNYRHYAEPCEWDSNGNPTKAISFADGKTYVVYSVADGQIEIKGKTYPIKLNDGYYIIRKLTVRECMRLQTVPEWYEFPVSNTQAYKMLGNGWTVDVIRHLLNSIQISR